MGIPKRLRLMETQARKVLCSRFLDLSSRHNAKSGGGATGKIHSLSTFQRYSQALGQAGKWCRQNYNLLFIGKMTPEMAAAYLDHRKAEGIGQKQLDNDRLSIQFMVGKLDRVKTLKTEEPSSRAYTKDESDRIAARQSPHNGLATRVAFATGMRAHEFQTLQRSDEAEVTASRQWRPDLFQGRVGDRYVVTGKGGLVREVLIPHELSRALEGHRLAEPRMIRDREINYLAHYDIGGGHSWSNSFSKRSMTELGHSMGAHGLRHAYAQSRYAQLIDRGLSVTDARQIITQEMGHFRDDVLDVYLR